MNPTEPANSSKPVFGPAPAVLALAVSGRWRAPETTAALAHQAAMQARSESDISTALLAEGWLFHGLLAVGRGSTGVARAAEALEDAVRSGDAAAEARLRVGLASAARELGDLDSASALLAPVIERDIIDSELAVDAYLEAIRCGGHPVAGGAHAAVDLAVSHIRTLRGEQMELGMAALDAALATQHRLGGRTAAAVARAREGLRRLLGESATGSELDPISPHLAATLSVELTTGLLDDGQPELACRVAEPALAWAARPAALVPLTRLRLVLAERAYLPAGQYDAALSAVGWAAGVLGEHDLPELEADCQSLLADVHERRGALSDALAASRRAHRALRVHSARVEQALVLVGRSAAGVAARPVHASPAWERTFPRRLDPAQSVAAVPPSHEGQAAPAGLDAAADSATVRLRSVPPRPAARDIPRAVPTATPAAFTASPFGRDWPEYGQPVRIHSERGDERNARPAAAMASESLDDWAAVTGWPGGPTTGTGPGSAYGPRTEFHRPEGIGAVSASGGGPDASGWVDAAATTRGFAPVQRVTPGSVFPGADTTDATDSTDTPDRPGTPDNRDELPQTGSGIPGDLDLEAATEDAGHEPADQDDTGEDEFGELFDPDERRPLGLVAIDVVTPKGPLTGYVAKPLLAHIADQARAQLPPNARLQVLKSDMVLVVLPPVDSDVVLRWMRSLSARLSASWDQCAADVPRSTYRVAVGAFDGEQSVLDNVEQLRARLAGVSRRPGPDPTSLAGGGRHVARRGPSSHDGSRFAVRDGSGVGTGGRRRRREGDGEQETATPSESPARTDSRTSGALGPSSRLVGTPDPGGLGTEVTERPSARRKGIDRVALARLTQMAWRPPSRSPEEIDEPAGGPGSESAVTERAASAGAVPRPVNGAAAGVLGNGVLGNGVLGNGVLGNGVLGNGSVPVDGAVDSTAAGTAPNAEPNGSGSEARDEPRGRTEASAVTELSFAELLAGALAAYRDG